VERSSALGVKRSELLGSKNIAGPSGTEQGTGIASKGVGLESNACSP